MHPWREMHIHVLHVLHHLVPPLGIFYGSVNAHMYMKCDIFFGGSFIITVLHNMPIFQF